MGAAKNRVSDTPFRTRHPRNCLGGSRFGVTAADARGQVQRFRKKPKANGVISAGYFAFNRRVLDYLGGPECILDRERLAR